MTITGNQLTRGDIRIDRDAMTASLGGCVLELTLQQYEVLLQLVLEEGRPVSQARLAHALWGSLPPRYSQHISVLVARLRSKLSKSRELRLITVHKRGYALEQVFNLKP
jgi:DNA-binding response OmpR family regulator